MNLRVNLITDVELRSSSIVTPKFILGLCGTLVLLAIAMTWGSAFLAVQHQAATITAEEQTWEQMQKSYELAKSVAARQQAAAAFMGDINKWQQARILWHATLTDLATATPPSIQLLELNLSSKLTIPDADSVPGLRPGVKATPAQLVPFRASVLKINGRTSSLTADTDVAFLRDAFTLPPLSNNVKSVAIPPGAFRQDPAPNASANDRIFEIACTYNDVKL